MKEYKITVIGDVMGEPPVVEGARTPDGGYDFSKTFASLAPMLSEADYRIANLETPLAGPTAPSPRPGEKPGYTSSIVSFNAPDQFAIDLKNAGIDMVTTANNHAVDRGYEGLVTTLNTLDRIGLGHTGTFRPGDTDRIFYFTAGDTRCAILSYTYATNAGINHVVPYGEYMDSVNYIRRPGSPVMTHPLPAPYAANKAFIEELLGRKLSWEENVMLKNSLNITNMSVDDFFDKDDADEDYKKVIDDYEEARKNADLVFFCPHIGGQFNPNVGNYSAYIMEKSKALGFDGVFAAHSHTSQKMDVVDGKPFYYSLGNVTMSPNTIYSVPECLPQYGIAAHVYVSAGKIVRNSFSIFKMVENEGHPMEAIPVDVLFDKLEGQTEKAALVMQVKAVYERVAQKPAPENVIRKEYILD